MTRVVNGQCPAAQMPPFVDGESEYVARPFRAVRRIGRDAFCAEFAGSDVVMICSEAQLASVARLMRPERFPGPIQGTEPAMASGGDAARFVGALFKHGILLDVRQAFRDHVWRDASAPGVRAAITTLCFPTMDRPDALARALESYTGNCARWGQEVGVSVVDVSTEEHHCRAARAACERIARGYRGLVRHADRARLDDFIHRIKSKTDALFAGVLQFALGLSRSCFRMVAPTGLHTYGAARNAHLLDTVGELIVSVDDDTQCVTSRPEANTADRVVISSEWYPFEWEFHGCMQRQPADFDFIGAHARVLGATAAQAVGPREVSKIDYREARSELILELLSNCATVSRSFLGVDGDSGLRSPLSVVLLGGCESKETAQRTYTRARWSRLASRSVSAVTIGDTGFCMAINIGLDNRNELPPFFPFQRNEDGIFGMMLHATRSGIAAFVPGTIDHRPVRPRSSTGDQQWDDLTRWRVPDYVLQMVSNVGGHQRRPAGSVTSAGIAELFSAAGRMPLKQLGAYLSDLRRDGIASALERIDRALAERGGPTQWRRDLVCAYSLLRASLLTARNREPVFADLDPESGEALPMVRELLLSFGEVVRYWPAIRAAVAEQKAKGLRVCVAVDPRTSREDI